MNHRILIKVLPIVHGNGEVKPTWVPYLLDNNMFTEAQKDSVDNKITEWKNAVYGSGFNWLYLVIGLLVIVIVILIIVKRKPKPPQSPVVAEE